MQNWNIVCATRGGIRSLECRPEWVLTSGVDLDIRGAPGEGTLRRGSGPGSHRRRHGIRPRRCPASGAPFIRLDEGRRKGLVAPQPPGRASWGTTHPERRPSGPVNEMAQPGFSLTGTEGGAFRTPPQNVTSSQARSEATRGVDKADFGSRLGAVDTYVDLLAHGNVSFAEKSGSTVSINLSRRRPGHPQSSCLLRNSNGDPTNCQSFETTDDHGFSTDLSSGRSRQCPTARILEIGHCRISVILTVSRRNDTWCG